MVKHFVMTGQLREIFKIQQLKIEQNKVKEVHSLEI
jgi:hypothetical protein